MRAAVIALALAAAVAASAQPIPPLAVPLGVTDLLAAAQPTVGYQFDGKPASSLGYGWNGFDPASGVYFMPEEGEGGKSQLFMHCPWVGGPGVAWADYALKLPATPRIRLSFEIGLRPGATHSDGVTYRILAGEKTLFEQNCTWREFRRFEADLSDFGGKEIVLRLQVDPGPKRNTTEDWSLWRDVRILAGTEAEVAAADRAARAQVAAARAADLERGAKLADASLLPLTSRAADSPCPGTLTPTQVSTREVGGLYEFRCQAADETITYRFDPRRGLFEGLVVLLGDRPLTPPPFRGGPRVHLDGRDFATPTSLLRTELLAATLDSLKLTCRYRYTNPETGSSAELNAILWPDGKSLRLEVSGEPDRFSGFSLLPFGGKTVTATFAVPGPPMWRREGVYLSTGADLMHSEASGVGTEGVTYTPLTNGKRNAMHDWFTLTVTSRYEEAFNTIPNKPSPFLDELAHRVVLDGWGGSFAENERWLKDMSLYGLDSFLMIKHVWQRDGYDQTYPDTMPANAAMGGDAALRELSLTAQRLGHRFNVHENYYDYYPNAEDFREADRCLSPQGQPIPGWDNGQVRAVILKPSKLMDYVRRFTPEIKRRYDCNSAYHDIMPTWNEDFDATVPDAGKIRVTHDYTRQLCDYDRALFGGPVVFEGADPNMAGIYDGGDNHGIDTCKTPVAVAPELLKVHPKMSNHGFGYYERWLPWGYSQPVWPTYVMTDRELDKYRTREVAFGRTGFIGQQLMQHPHGVVREFYLMQAFGRAYTGKLAARIRYQVDGKWLDAGTAARYGELSRLNVEYEGGQQVYVNMSAEPWEVAGRVLPPDGTLTLGLRSEAWTALRDGQICDYAAYENVTYADARSQVWQPPTMLPPITPSVGALKPLGGKQFELTVNWQVGRKPERDYTIFWHFKAGSKIEFQADHAPATPATTWQVGQTIADGPHRLTVKDDQDVTRYDIVVGLYDKEGRGALVRGAGEMRIGELVVQRNGAEATAVSLAPAAAEQYPGADPATYLEGANVARKIIDFGPVATNGAVVLRKTAAGSEIIPVPRGERFSIGLPAAPDLRIAAFAADGSALPGPTVTQRDGKLWFETSPEAARYVVAP